MVKIVHPKQPLFASPDQAIAIIDIHNHIISYQFFILIVPAVAPGNVAVTRSESDIRALIVTWEPLTLVEAKGFINYTVTLTPGGSQTGTLTRTVSGDQNSTTFTDTDPTMDYTVKVGTLTSNGLSSGPGRFS